MKHVNTTFVTVIVANEKTTRLLTIKAETKKAAWKAAESECSKVEAVLCVYEDGEKARCEASTFEANPYPF